MKIEVKDHVNVQRPVGCTETCQSLFLRKILPVAVNPLTTTVDDSSDDLIGNSDYWSVVIYYRTFFFTS